MKKLSIALIVACAAVGMYYIHAYELFSMKTIQDNAYVIERCIKTQYLFSVLVYIGMAIALSMFAVPVFIPVTIASGYFFGTILGAIYSVIGGTVGSIIVFLMVRYFFGAAIQKRYGERLTHFNEHIKKEGPYYIVILHIVGVVPFVVINTLAALTHISLWNFTWASVVGFLPIALVLTFTGQQLTFVDSAHDIFSARMIGIILLLLVIALLPVIMRRLKKWDGM